MDYTKFYTPPLIAQLLIQQLKITLPSEVVDICCGSCNLLHAAGTRWPSAKLIGVDIVAHTISDVACIESDGRKFALEHAGEYPLVLANPPFDFVRSKQEFPTLFDDLSFNFNTSRLEIEMLLANLKILRENGTLLIIVPSTLVTAEKYRKVRIWLSTNYHIQKVIYLPDDTFGSSNISSCALIIKREKLLKHYTYRFNVTHNNNEYSISKGTIISQNQMRSGNWGVLPVALSKTVFMFRRGNISSQQFSKTGTAVLHTSKPSTPWKPSVRYIPDLPRNAVFADKNDIIISRVGKSAGQWCKYDGPRILISDCLYVLSDATGSVFDKINGKQYPFSPKGVATRYITMSDFGAWLNSL